MELKFNFLTYYGKLEQITGKTRAAIRRELAADLGVKITTLLKWEKVKVNEDESFSKADIHYCCAYFGCTRDEFTNHTTVQLTEQEAAMTA